MFNIPVWQLQFCFIFRFTISVTAITMLAKLNKDDVIYAILPLYHSLGGVIGMGQMILNGCTVALRRKFSVSHFWKECVKYKCTVIENSLLNDIACSL